MQGHRPGRRALRRRPRRQPDRCDDPRCRDQRCRPVRGEHRQDLDRLRRRQPSSRRSSATRSTSSTTRTPPGVAELEYGAADHHEGLVILTTLGTGIGTALIHHGRLVPNSELGHIELDGHDAESRAAQSAQEREGLSWEAWAERLQRYYSAPGEPPLARPLRRRGRGLQERRQVPPAPRHPHPDQAGVAAEQGRHHRRRPPRRPGRQGLLGEAGRADYRVTR